MFSSETRRLFKNFRSADVVNGLQLRVLLSLAVFVSLFPSSVYAQMKSSSPSFATLSKRAAEARDADRLTEAVALYARALALRPKWVEGWWSLGTLDYDQDHYAKAALDFEKVITLDAKNGTAHAMLGLCQFELGKDEPALKNFLEAERIGVVKDEQLRKVALYHLGVLELRARKYGDAKGTLLQLAKDGGRTKELITAPGQGAMLVRPQEAPPEGTPEASVIERSGEAEALLAAEDVEPAEELQNARSGRRP